MSSSKKIPSFEQLSRAILPLGKPLHKLTLVFGECQVKVSSNSAKLDSVLRHYFYEFVKPTESYNFEVICIEADPMQLELPFRLKDPSPGKAKVKEEYCDLPGGRVVKKRLTGLNLLMGDNGQNIAFGPCEDNDNQVINFINSRYLEWLLKEPSVLGHAAGVRFMNQGFAFAGIAGAGKSTLALHLMSQGADFVSNDRLVIKPKSEQTWMQGLPKLPRINPGTALNNPDLIRILTNQEVDYFARMPHSELWQVESKYDVYLKQCFQPGNFVLETPVQVLMILNWHLQGEPTQFQPVDLSTRRDLLRVFMKETGLFVFPEAKDAKTDANEEQYLQALSPLLVFEARGKVDFKKAVKFCRELAETSLTPSPMEAT